MSRQKKKWVGWISAALVFASSAIFILPVLFPAIGIRSASLQRIGNAAEQGNNHAAACSSCKQCGDAADEVHASAHAVPPDADEARRLSPLGWSPPAAFAKVGSPAPPLVFPRGEHAQRRYADPITNPVPGDLRDRAPAVLAMTPADGRLHLLPEEIDHYTLLARRMVLDTGALNDVVEGQTARILAPTTGDEVLTLEFHTVKMRSANTHTLLGRVVGEEELSDVQLVYHDGIIHGSVSRYAKGIDQHLEYRILADGHMMVRELDSAAMKAVCGYGPEYDLSAELTELLQNEGLDASMMEDEVFVRDSPAGVVMDVVVGYDQGARIADGGYAQIEGRILSSVDRMNTAFANSEIFGVELALLGTIEDPDYVFPGTTAGSQSDELSSLRTFGNGTLDAISDYYTLLGADLIVFVQQGTDGSAGLANRPGFASVVARTYMTANRITFAHELGHNLGLEHSWGDSSQAYHSHYGWRLDPPDSARVRTIMAYDWGWTRIPYFANPGVTFSGAATGAVNGYNVLGDDTTDPRYYQGGMGYNGSDPNRFGFNGENMDLAANAAETIRSGAGNANYGALRASNRRTRTDFAVVTPANGAVWTRGTRENVFFTGGDGFDGATIELYQGGVLHSVIATGLNPATDRNYYWMLPIGLSSSDDYMIRVMLERGETTFTADSGIFSISGATPQVVVQFPPSAASVIGPISELSLTFNQPMDPASFAVVDDIISFASPTGADLKPEILDAGWSSDDTILTLTFSDQSVPGIYQLVLGSQIEAADGVRLDQNQNEIPGESPGDYYTAVFEIDAVAPADLLLENFDVSLALPAGWTSSSADGDGEWTVVDSNSHTPNHATFIPNYTNVTKTYLTSPVVVIPAGARDLQLRFWHFYHLETNFDGGLLEFSVDGGDWLDMEDGDHGGIFLQNGYNSTISSSFDSPIGGRSAWSGDSDGFVETVVDLSDVSIVADGSLQFRWVLGTDSSIGWTGWYVDTVSLNALVPIATDGRLVVTPVDAFVSSGHYGGLFLPASQEYTLSNPGTNAISWAAETDATWISLSTPSGTLGPGDSADVTVMINSSAEMLLAGTYSGSVHFENVTSGDGSFARVVSLVVTVPDAPLGVAAVPSLGRVDVMWDGAAGASRYRVSRASVAGGPYGLLGTTEGTSFVDASVVAGETYYYVVTSLNDGGMSPDSAELSATVPQALPFMETFDGVGMASMPGMLSGQRSWQSGEGAVVEPGVGVENSQALRVTADEVVMTFANGTNHVYLRAWLKAVGGEDPIVPADSSAVFWVDTNNFVRVYSNETVVVLPVEVAPDQYSRFEVWVDYDAGTWRLDVNGVLAGAMLETYSVQPAFREIALVNTTQDPAYFDDISITSDSGGALTAFAQWLVSNGYAQDTSPDTLAANGVNTLREMYVAGLAPADPASRFVIGTFEMTGDDPVLHWLGVEGRLYSVYWSSNLVEGAAGFQLLQSEIPWNSTIFTDTVERASGKGFYRIEVQLE